MYILSHSSISPQHTYTGEFTEGNIIEHPGNTYAAIEPDYTDVIPRGLLRRMGKATRIGIGAGMLLINKHENIDGIILGTGTGGMQACVEFLNQIIQYNEGTLTPTNFIQSTPNAVAGSLAMMSNNIGFNNTHINSGLSFEGALLDAMLQFEEGEVHKLLVGAIEETSEYDYNIDNAAGLFKKEEVPSSKLLTSGTEGSVRGEGATMFIVSDKNENAICEMVDVMQFSFPQSNNIEERAIQFLSKNEINIEEVDAVVLGYNGDSRSDFWYEKIAEHFNQAAIYSYKNLVGDFPTANAFAMWLSCLVFEGKHIPEEVLMRKSDKAIKTILIYNHYISNQHSFILLKAP